MSSEIENANIKEVSPQSLGDANTAATRLSLEGQGRLQETVKGTDVLAIGDGGVRNFTSSDVKTAQAVENTGFAAQLLAMQLTRMETQIGKIPNAAA